MISICGRLLALVLFCLGVGKSWHLAKDGYSPLRTEGWKKEVSGEFSEETTRALSQTYRYLSRGHQCYAFMSDDGEYVIKIPRTDRYHLPFWLRALPFLDKMREKKRADLAFREQFLLESFRISYDELKEQTALLAMHLGTSKGSGLLKIVDPIGRQYDLPLHRTAFILQRKKPILMAEFQQALKGGNRVEAERILRAFLDTIAKRASHGILNKDPSFIRNFGFDGERAFQIDIGSFYRKEGIVGREAYLKSLRETTAPVKEWLATLDRDMCEKFQTRLEELCQEL